VSRDLIEEFVNDLLGSEKAEIEKKHQDKQKITCPW